MSDDQRVANLRKDFRKYGKSAMENARKRICDKYATSDSLAQSLQYFSESSLNKALPVFPALTSMSCLAVGGNLSKAISFGEALIFITAAADLHDDVLDNSINKHKKPTVFGKFGSDIAILAGDVLLVDGIRLLSNASTSFSNERSVKIMAYVSEAVYEICAAEALERQLRLKEVILPQDYYEVIRLKSVVPEVTMKIGAIVGGGSDTDIENLSKYGRSYGLISGIVEEFADLLEEDEFNSRLKNECPPLPLIYALQNDKIKEKLNPLLKSNKLTSKTHKQIIELVLASKEVKDLENNLLVTGKKAIDNLKHLNEIDSKIREKLENMLLVPLSYF
jgi:geranylgeranyl pyrophosphate synthase